MAHIQECLWPLRKRKVLSAEAVHALRVRGDEAEKLGAYRTIWNTSYMLPGTVDRPYQVCIPHALNSVETLEFLGFDRPTAIDLWNRFCALTSVAAYPPPLIRVAKDHLCAFDAEAIEKDSGWGRRMGLEMDFVFRLRHTAWAATRGKGGLKSWVIGLVDMRFRLLLCLDEVVRTGNRAEIASLHPAALMVCLR
ncbi:hypothetical protein MMC17_004905 [Xylographa soralifera]|nr:hypothetical protein [Xylographa soralifera]